MGRMKEVGVFELLEGAQGKNEFGSPILSVQLTLGSEDSLPMWWSVTAFVCPSGAQECPQALSMCCWEGLPLCLHHLARLGPPAALSWT